MNAALQPNHKSADLQPATRGREAQLRQIARERILILDGGWGTEFQKKSLGEADYRGDIFREHKGALKGNHDLLALTRPDIVAAIHDDYFAAGADITSTNSFSATAIAQADYGLEASAPQIAAAAARVARQAADAWTEKTPDKPRFVAGSLGPTNRTLSLSPDVNDPGFRAVSFDAVYEAYAQQIRAMAAEGVDILLIETIFDTLNAKAAIKAALDLFDGEIATLPIWISGTITDRSGRTLSGQTLEAFWNSVRHAKPFAIGLNCALGADLMRPFIAELARIADTLVSAYPNAGLPNAMGQYDELPHQTCGHLAEWMQSGIVNIVGGCCGTSPEHIAHLAQASRNLRPRLVPRSDRRLRLSGLEPFSAS